MTSQQSIKIITEDAKTSNMVNSKSYLINV